MRSVAYCLALFGLLATVVSASPARMDKGHMAKARAVESDPYKRNQVKARTFWPLPGQGCDQWRKKNKRNLPGWDWNNDDCPPDNTNPNPPKPSNICTVGSNWGCSGSTPFCLSGTQCVGCLCDDDCGGDSWDPNNTPDFEKRHFPITKKYCELSSHTCQTKTIVPDLWCNTDADCAGKVIFKRDALTDEEVSSGLSKRNIPVPYCNTVLHLCSAFPLPI